MAKRITLNEVQVEALRHVLLLALATMEEKEPGSELMESNDDFVCRLTKGEYKELETLLTKKLY